MSQGPGENDNAFRRVPTSHQLVNDRRKYFFCKMIIITSVLFQYSLFLLKVNYLGLSYVLFVSKTTLNIDKFIGKEFFRGN